METTTRNATLADLRDMLMEQQARKVDVIAPASKIRAVNGNLEVADTEAMLTPTGVQTTAGIYRPTEVCDEGIASKLEIPPSYVKRLRQQRPDLYDANVNGWLHGGGDAGHDPRSFLLRAFSGDDGEGVARAFLSDRYAIIDHLDALMAAMQGVQQAGVTVAVKGCDLSDRRMYVKVEAPEVRAYAPELLRGYRSPFSGATGSDNPTVFAGFVISNSETGGGALSIVPRITVQVCSNGMTVTKDAMRAVHLGGKNEEGIIRWSQDTNDKTLELITAKARDAVATFVNVDYMKRILDGMAEAASVKITKPDEVVRSVTKRLAFTQEAQDQVFSMFIEGGQITAGGVMQAVTAAAQTVQSADEAADMESQAFRALELAAAATWGGRSRRSLTSWA